MKKFLVILMVVAMASVLFVGCTTPPTPEPEPEPTPTPTPTVQTDVPYITSIGSISLSSTSTQYSNSATTGGVSVEGAIIKLYIDDVQAGVTNSGATGTFSAIVSMVTLTEGVKVLHVTATQPGLAESDASTKYTFTYDYTAPTIASVVADSATNGITVTFDENVNMNTSSALAAIWAASALNYANWTLQVASGADVMASTYTISKMSDKVVKITCPSATNITLGTVYTVGVLNVYDTATNPILTRVYGTCLGTP